MNERYHYSEVIIPLSIPRLLTYAVPEELLGTLQLGHRVLVPLAGKHFYTGIVRTLHNEKPEQYVAVAIHSLMDAQPLVNHTQLLLWDRLAAYYMCSLGEVMAAALPGALLLASETKLVAAGNYREHGNQLTDREYLICEALEVRDRLTLAEVAELLQIKTVHPLIKSLMEKGLVGTEEEMEEKYSPKTVAFVGLVERMNDERLLVTTLNMLEKKAAKQAEVLLRFLQMRNAEGLMNKITLQKAAGATSSIVKQLVEKDILTVTDVVVDRLAVPDDADLKPVFLSVGQQAALTEIHEGFTEKKPVLLQGITGSGKTEVYIKLMEETVARGEQVLFLLPEIALTAQMIQRLRTVFGSGIGLYHSKFSQNERVEIWHKVAEGGKQFQIVLGARSGLFLPFKKLGLIIVDEEHEYSYKQNDPAPRYNARDASMFLAALHHSEVLLGSATPSLESRFNADEGRYAFVRLSERFSQVELPEIHLNDLRSELKMKSMKGIFSGQLYEAMNKALAEGEKIILFQNRRGFSSLWQCTTCGWTPECTRCDVSLTYHKRTHELRCHYCGHKDTPPGNCKACESTSLRMIGFGTERVEEELQTHFPTARFLRLDMDTARNKHAHRDIIEQFASGEIDVLIGTQMVSKGLDFDHVGLVGILNADLLFKFPDFRAHERAFQLMVQVAGRAGRNTKRGQVIIQTYDPDFWLMDKIRNHDYDGFYTQELAERKIHGYPPFYRIIKIGIRHRDQATCDEAAAEYGRLLRADFGSRVLGPEYHFIPRIRNQYIKQILIKIERGADPGAVRKKIKELNTRFAHLPNLKNVRLVVDVDPA